MTNEQLTLLIQAQNNASRELANLRNDVNKLGTDMGRSISNASASAGRSFLNFANGAQTAFGNVASSIENVAKKALLLVTGSGLTGAYFVNLASELQTAQTRMAALAGDTDVASKAFGELYNYTLGKPIAFPEAAKAAQTLMGYGVSAKNVVNDMKTLSKFSIVNGADMSMLALAYGQVQAKGKLMGQEVLQLTNNFVPVRAVLAKFYGSTKKAQEAMDDGTVTAEIFSKAMANFIPDSAIQAQADTFKNRMISLQGTLRSTGLAILGVKVDPVKGYLIEAGGLFDRLSKAVADASKWLKDNKQTIVDVGNIIADNLVPALGTLAAAWVTAKVAMAAIGFAKFVTGIMQFITAIRAGAGAMAAFNAVTAINPFVAIATAITALIAGLVFLQLKFDIFGKALAGIQTAAQPMVTFFQQNILPVLQQVAGFIGGIFMNAWNQLKAAWTQLMIAIQPIMPVLQTVGKVILGVLVVALLATLAPIAAVVAAVIGIVTAIAFVIGKIAQFAAWLIGKWNQISGTVGAIIGGFVSRVIGFFSGMYSSVVGFVSRLVGSVTSFFGGLRNNVVGTVSSTINNVVSFFRNLPSRIISGLGNLGSTLVGAGGDLIRGLLNGISNGAGAITEKMKSIASGAVDTVKSFLGIKSPSRVFAQIGTYTMQGLNNGLEGMKRTVVGTAQGVARAVTNGFDTSLSTPNASTTISGAAAASNRLQGANGGNVNQSNSTTNQFLAPINLNTKEAVDAWYDKINAQQGRDQQLAQLGVAL